MDELTKVFEQFDVSRNIISMGLLMARCLGMVFLAPFLGGKLVPSQVRFTIAITLSIVVFPILLDSGELRAIFETKGYSYPLAMNIVLYLVKEVFVGFILGFIIQTIWHAAEMIGRFVDTARGSAMGTALVPQMKSQSSVFASLYYQLLIIVFLLLDGDTLFIDYFVRSYIYIPIAQFPRIDTGLWPFFDMLIRITGGLFEASIKMGAPVIIAVFITDVSMALLNKVSPQINTQFLGMPLKAALGVLFSMLALYLFVQQSEHMMATALNYVWKAILYLRPF